MLGDDQSLLSWAAGLLSDGDEEASSAISTVLGEILVFYLLTGIGFVALWLTWRSGARVRQLKTSAAAVLRDERAKRFEPEDSAKLHGYF